MFVIVANGGLGDVCGPYDSYQTVSTFLREAGYSETGSEGVSRVWTMSHAEGRVETIHVRILTEPSVLARLFEISKMKSKP